MTKHQNSLDEIAEEQEGAQQAAPTGRRRASRRSPLRSLLPLILVIVVVVGVGVAGVAGYRWVSGNVSVGEPAAQDYPGPGSGEVIIEIERGDTGSDIADTLVEHDVIRSAPPFVTLFGNTPEAGSITPGQYSMLQQMSSAGALDRLLDPASAVGIQVTIPEGQRLNQIWPQLSEETGIPVEDFEAAAADPAALGMPENPAGTIEGYLWPGSYEIREDATAEDVIVMMWERMESELDDRGVAPENRHEVLTIASIAEREARTPEDFGMVVRTILNRLEGVGEAGGTPMPLQLDSTVTYVSERESFSTTPEERAVDSPYNTYRYPGLPIGPIGNPGAATLDATLNPPEGEWLYWVTVNTETGETKFSETKAEHDANVEQWREWARNRDA